MFSKEVFFINVIELTSEVRLNNLFSSIKIDRVPLITNASIYFGVQGRLKSKDFFLNPQKSFDCQKYFIKVHGCDSNPSFDYPGYNGALFGGDLKHRDCPYVDIPILKPVIESLEDLKKVDNIDFKNNNLFLKEVNFYEQLVKCNKKVPINLGSPLEIASNFCDLNFLLRLFKKDIVALDIILDIATDFLIKKGNYLIEKFGVKNCYAYANFPIESLLSPKIAEKYILKYFSRVLSYFKEKGIDSYSFHLCGDHSKNLETFLAINLPNRSIISLDEKIEVTKASLILGDRFIIGGNIPTSILLNGTSRDVFVLSKKLIEENMYRDGGFILMPSCTLPPKTPPQNLFAMLEASKNHGKYN